MESFVRAAALTNFDKVVGALGFNPDAALRRADLPLRALKEPELRLPADKVARLLEDTAGETGCDTIGLRMVQSRRLSNFGAVSLLLAYQATLRDVLKATATHLHLLNNALVLQMEDVGSKVVVREEMLVPQPARQATELALGALYMMCAALMGEHWRPVSVSFCHTAPRDRGVHRQVFGCPIEFNADFNGIVFRASDLDVPNPSADPRLLQYARALLEAMPSLEGESISREVSRAIYLMLPSGRVTCELVARGLGRSLRTLQRQLDEEGTSFTALLAASRQNLARRYIANPGYSLGHVAGLLGYSTHSAFTRWFTTQFGQSPAEWRRRTGSPAQAARKATRPGGHKQ